MLPHYKDGTDTGTTAGRNESHTRRDGLKSKGKKMKTNQAKMNAQLEEMKA
jgi:hypothetical protein